MTFGDIEPEDEFSADGTLDAEQVARRLHEYRVEEGDASGSWDSLTTAQRRRMVRVIIALLHWLRRQGALRA